MIQLQKITNNNEKFKDAQSLITLVSYKNKYEQEDLGISFTGHKMEMIYVHVLRAHPTLKNLAISPLQS